jgi:hypothetical protein
MSLVWLSLYVSLVLALLSVLSCAITYAPPGPGLIGRMLPVVFACGALCSCVLTLVLSLLPRGHWVHSHKPLKNVLVAAAVTATLLLVLVG